MFFCHVAHGRCPCIFRWDVTEAYNATVRGSGFFGDAFLRLILPVNRNIHIDTLKSPKPHNISYTNIRRLRSNFRDLQVCVTTSLTYLPSVKLTCIGVFMIQISYYHQDTCQCITRIPHTCMFLPCMSEIAFLLLVTSLWNISMSH